MDIQPSVYTRLLNFRSNDDAARLFSSILNYEYSGKTLPIKQFPSSLDGRITRLQVLAGYDDFKVLHCEVDQLLLGVERPIINSLLKDHPYSLFLFSDSKKSAWHFINVKYDEEESRRRIFRRIVVGPDERLHTASQRISMLEIPDERTLSPLELQELHDKAFDVEAVTKEFFRSFATMFGVVKEEIEELNPRYKGKAGEFSQMLLDRLMFLYFIQKKGWLNNQGNYLFDRFRKGFKDQPENHNYYTDVILRVFQRLAFADLQFKDLGSLPFLNGGLFEIDLWESSLKLSNGLFGRLFKDLFEHYNFTVREDTAMDMEVAIDPEMLGKVFENLVLLQEKDPTTDLRKATGSYYTPRVIVHFMSEQSLKEYLIENAYEPEGFGLRKDVLQFTDSAYEKSSKQITFDAPQQIVLKKQIREKIDKLFTLNPAGQLADGELMWLKNSFTMEEAQRLKTLILNCRVCDPAVGSGAFVVGMLHVMIAIIKLLDVRLKGIEEIRRLNYDYELKRKIIEYCLYGVDIQEQAVRICELRLWLSLVVDYDAAGGDVPPLPNLSYRIRKGNSLIDQLFGYNVNLNLKTGSEKGEKLKQLVDSIQNDKHAYFYEPDIEKKRSAEVGILAKQCDLSLQYLKLRQDQVLEELESKYSKGLFDDKKLKKAEEEEKLAMKHEMKELDKLMLHVKQTKDKLTKGVTWGKKSIDEIKEAFGFTFAWKLDFAEVFKDRNGFDVVIANPPYGLLNKRQNRQESIVVTQEELNFYKTAKEYEPACTGMINVFRLFVLRSIGILNSRGCFAEIFPLAFVGDLSASGLRKSIIDKHTILHIEAFPERDNERKRVFEPVKMSVCIVVLKKIENVKREKFFVRIHRDRYVDVNNTKAWLNRSTVLSLDNTGYTIPLTSQAETDLLVEIFKRSIRLSDLAHCYTGEIDLTGCKKYLTDNPKDTRLLKGAMVDRYLITDEMSQGEIKFLAAARYLKENRGEKTQHHQFERIIMQGITGVNERVRLKMTLTNANVFCANSVNYIVFLRTDINLKYILGVLNSKLLNFVFSCFSTNSNVNGYEVDNLPLPRGVDGRTVSQISEKVQSILAITGNNVYPSDSKTQKALVQIDEEINLLVYRSLGLSDKNIQIVEGR